MLTGFAMIVLALLLGLYAYALVYTFRVEQAYPPGQTVSVNGADMHVLQSGTDGPLVVMLHGASANAREYEASLAPLLADTHRVMMIDRPGHGYSQRVEAAETLAVQASQIAGVLKALAPQEQAIIVGHSFGGAVALRLALDYPELAHSLILLAPVTHDWGGGGQAWYNKYAGHTLIGPVFSLAAPIAGPLQVQQGITGVFDPERPPDGYFEAAGVSLLFRPSQFRANAKDVNALQSELAAQQVRYSELTLPVKVFSGAGDTVLSPRLHVGRLKKQVTDLHLIPLEDGGHMPHHGYGPAIAASIRDLSGLE